MFNINPKPLTFLKTKLARNFKMDCMIIITNLGDYTLHLNLRSLAIQFTRLMLNVNI